MDITEMSSEADDPAGLLIHYHDDPVCLQGDRLSMEYIYAPYDVFCEANCR